mgnify:CR=1 FL=1
MSRNVDGRKTTKLADGTVVKKNFNIYYEIDGEEVGTALRADEYDGEEGYSWLLLESTDNAAPVGPSL